MGGEHLNTSMTAWILACSERTAPSMPGLAKHMARRTDGIRTNLNRVGASTRDPASHPQPCSRCATAAHIYWTLSPAPMRLDLLHHFTTTNLRGGSRRALSVHHPDSVALPRTKPLPTAPYLFQPWVATVERRRTLIVVVICCNILAFLFFFSHLRNVGA
jgi:hypothetical protein